MRYNIGRYDNPCENLIGECIPSGWLSVSIATESTLDYSQDGPDLIIMHHYSYHRKVKTIHSSVNIECYNDDVNYKEIKVRSGEKQILTH